MLLTRMQKDTSIKQPLRQSELTLATGETIIRQERGQIDVDEETGVAVETGVLIMVIAEQLNS